MQKIGRRKNYNIMKKVFVSGCYDIIHGGHIQFFRQAKSLGDHLTVCVASDEVIRLYKNKPPSLPLQHKISILKSLSIVDDVLVSSNIDSVFDFKDHFLRIKPDYLVVTEDDKNREEKKELCKSIGTQFVVTSKDLNYNPISTTDILKKIKAPTEAPLRVDFAGGWLDVPKLSSSDGYIVNCSINLFVSLNKWEVPKKAGLGGSAAWAILNGENSLESELDLGIRWQDLAIISETGLCVWRSEERPVLEIKTNPDFLTNMYLYWIGNDHDTPAVVDNERDYELIKRASRVGYYGVLNRSLDLIRQSVYLSYTCQLEEGMKKLPSFGEVSKKYCGGGWGGYALYMFDKKVEFSENLLGIEGYIRNI